MVKRTWRDLVLPAWKLTFALVAICDIQGCFLDDKGYTGISLIFLPKKSTVGVLFCSLCLVEAVVRAREARQIAFENAALDYFEQKLARLYSTTRCHVFRQQPGEEDYRNGEHEYLNLARYTLRVWTPVATTLTVWFLLLPWTGFLGSNGGDDGGVGFGYCDEDTALATIWMKHCMDQMSTTFRYLQSKFFSIVVWDILFPISIWYHPKRFYRRIRQILRWIRHIRYSGPLVRLFLKLFDQFTVIKKTYRQSWKAKVEKAKRITKRSMLFDDIRRIESFTKVQTALASIPSQLFNLIPQQDQHQATDYSIQLAAMRQKKKEGQKLKQRFKFLKLEIEKCSSMYPSSQLYDEIVELTQEIKIAVGTAIFSSHLISPQTRFSVGWRLIVTVALLSELFRLFASWQISGTFDVSITDIMLRSSLLVVQCDDKNDMEKRMKMMEWFRFATRQGEKSVRWCIGKLFRRLPNHNAVEELTRCMPTSSSSQLFLQMGGLFESTIDIVCFIDIFVWFFTGELDAKGVVIPKPFITRCVVPGTLVQVLDHPTLPDKLPQLIQMANNTARVVGYSRVIRWVLAIYPALEMLLVDPCKAYLFRPMEKDEFLRYTESLALYPTAFSPSSCPSGSCGSSSNTSSSSIRNTTTTTTNNKKNRNTSGSMLLSHPSGMLSYPGEKSSSGMPAAAYPSISNHMNKVAGGNSSLGDSFSFSYSVHY